MAAASSIKVIVADDDRSIRALVRLEFRAHEDIIIVAEAENGQDTVALALEHQPDVIVMDYEMPVLNGIEATAKIKQALPAIKVVLFTSNNTQDAIDAAFAAGAMGFLDKQASGELPTAVRMLVQGRSFFSG
jgi:DNA-binding NarL/FixJ family response regulator